GPRRGSAGRRSCSSQPRSWPVRPQSSRADSCRNPGRRLRAGLLRGSLELTPPAEEKRVHRCSAHERIVLEGQRGRVEQERPGLGPPEPAVEADQLLEGAAFLEG